MEYINKFCDYLSEVKHSSDNTLISYRRDLCNFEKFLNSTFGNIDINNINNINKTTIMSYIYYLQKNNMSNATISRNISSIRAFFRFLLNNGFVKVDPTIGVVSPTTPKRFPEVISLEDVNSLLEQPDLNNNKGVRDKAMLEMVYATGMRVSELVSIKIDDLNLSMEYVKCKNANKERIIPLGSKVLKSIKNYLGYSRNVLLRGNESSFLFLNINGHPMTRQGFWKIIKYYAKLSGIKDDITPHTLRHSFAVHLIQNGCDLHSLQEMLGHSDISTTQVYAKKVMNNKLKDVYVKSHPRA